MRLVAQAKMGYYPTPEHVTPLIAAYLRRQGEGTIKIFDPCAGEGTAVTSVGRQLQAETYGIELDHERGSIAKEILTRCLITDYQNTAISHGAFSLLYLNPPYDWTAKTSEIEAAERYERTFLRHCFPYLCPRGVLVYLIPQRRLDGHVARILSYRFGQISVFRFPEKEYQSYKQLVIFATLKPNPSHEETVFEYLKNCGLQRAVVPYLPQDPPHIYGVPVSPEKVNFIFKSKDIDPEELAAEVLQHGLFKQFGEMITPLSLAERIRPVMPLRHGHMAQILACGLMNGVVWDRQGKNPLLVKGTTLKKIKTSVEINDDVERQTATDQIAIIIQAFNRHGELLTIQ
ncbi:MAG: class I SAM-dependent methyltransferase [Deltaproteobacteria bacterium]|nr:class I SAM-dependent methyltransferase [Deltaproteobacteria bacterium]